MKGRAQLADRPQPFDIAEIAHFRRVADVLSGVYRDAGDRSGAEVLQSAEYDSGHA